MRTSLRWGTKGLSWLLTVALVETGIWGIPEALAEEVSLLEWLNTYGLIRLIVALVLALFLAGATIGPTTLSTWRRSFLDWYHSSARQIEQLQEQN